MSGNLLPYPGLCFLYYAVRGLCFSLPLLYLNDAARLHKEALLTTLVEVHKAQCYFSSLMQVKAFLSCSRKTRSMGNLFVNALAVLATSDMVPIVLTLACIVRMDVHLCICSYYKLSPFSASVSLFPGGRRGGGLKAVRTCTLLASEHRHAFPRPARPRIV